MEGHVCLLRHPLAGPGLGGSALASNQQKYSVQPGGREGRREGGRGSVNEKDDQEQ